MNDRKLYERLLGIESPWSVADVTLALADGQVLVTLDCSRDAERCPECGERCPGYDRHERRWRHLDTFQYRTILVASVPRIQCPDHGVKTIRVPWAEERSRFTALFESLVIEWLRNTEQLAAVATGMRLSWDEVDGIRSRAVARGLARRGKASLPAAIGVDETSFRKGHEYVTVVNALGERQVLDVTDDRKEASLTAFYAQYTVAELAAIEFVAMDMWEPYIAATRGHLAHADTRIVFDRFHVAKHLGDAVDRVGRREHRALRTEGETTLTKTKYLWLTSKTRLAWAERRQLAALSRSALETARAFRYKEWASELWAYVRWGNAKRGWESWLRSALRCSLEPVKRVARMIGEHLWGVLNAAASGITNAMSESVNASIQRIKKRACGFRSRPRFRIAILFHLGGLDLYPRLTPSAHTKS